MQGSDEREPIEIELRGASESVEWSARDERSTVSSGGPPSTGRTRDASGRAVAAATAGAVALVLGIVIGRASTGDDTGSVAATATTAPAPASSSLVLETLPAPPPAPTTTVKRTTTTTLLIEDSTTHLGAPLAGRAIEIVGATFDSVVRIDATTGATRRIAVTANPDGPPSLLAGDGWVLRPSWDPSRPTVIVHDDGATTEIDSGSGSPIYASPDGTTIWVVEDGMNSVDGFRLVERLPSGEPTGAVVESAGYVFGIDPLGGVVVSAPGGAYRVDGDAVEQLTTGGLLSVSEATLFVEECDEQLTCQHAVVDRATGQRRPIDLTEILGTSVGIDTGGWWLGNNPMAPGGDAVFLTVYTDDPFQSDRRTGILDLTTSEFVELPGVVDMWANPMQWSPDGELVIWASSTGLSVYDRTDGTTTVIGDDPLRFTAFTIRALDPAS